jgi:hypothetical protein
MYLSPDELEKCAYVVNIDNQLFGTDPSVKLSADINALDLITLGSSFQKSRMTFLYAKTGRKIELQEYATYPHDLRPLLEMELTWSSVHEHSSTKGY